MGYAKKIFILITVISSYCWAMEKSIAMELEKPANSVCAFKAVLSEQDLELLKQVIEIRIADYIHDNPHGRDDLIAANDRINAKILRDRSLWHFVVSENIDEIKELLEQELTFLGLPLALALAARFNKPLSLKVLLEKTSKQDHKDSAFEEAVRAGSCEAMDVLLESGISDYYQGIGLKKAAKKGHKTIVEKILSRGKVDSFDKKEACKAAMKNNHTFIVDLVKKTMVNS